MTIIKEIEKAKVEIILRYENLKEVERYALETYLRSLDNQIKNIIREVT